jgi:hypothetical protein
MSGTPITTLRQHSDRSVPAEAWDILAAGHVAHVGFVDGGHPYVIPFSYHFEPGDPPRIYLHGGPESRALAVLATGAPACVEVTLLDGLVYSRTALYHSMNYRSAIAFGRGRPVMDCGEKRVILERMIARYFEGRAPGRDYEPSPDTHLTTTSLIEIAIDSVSAKARRGGPKGPRDADPDAPGSSGVVPLRDR